MAKLFKWLMVMLIPLFSLAFTSCGGEDKDEPDAPSTTTSDVVKGTVGENYVVNLYQNGPNSVWFSWCGSELRVDANYGSNPKIAGCGIVRGLKEITVVPSDGWGKKADVVDNGGYVIMFTLDGVQKYVRLMVTTNRDATGQIRGINYSYQFFTPSNL